MIVEDTYNLIKNKYGKRFELVTIKRLVAGIYFTAVELSSGYSGLAYANPDSLNCCTHTRKKGFGDFTPGNFKGRKVSGLFSHPDQSLFIKNIQLAVMNALSAELLAETKYPVVDNRDPIELVDLKGEKQVCVVGAFLSYIKKIAATDCTLKIVELNEAAVPDEYKQYLVPSPLSESAITQSDIVIITGATLANNSLDRLLEIIPQKTQVVLVGPTSNLLPDVLFKRGVNIIGATRITDTAKMLEMVAEGATGFHLFNYCATKICLVNES